MKNIYFLLFILLPVLASSQQQHLDVEEHFKEIETSEILLLGSFHFNDAGLDTQ